MAQNAERIVEAILAERLLDGTDVEANDAYNRGIDDAAAAVRRVAVEPDPLRELAEWLVSLDGDPLLVERPTPADMKAIVRRAREALGRKEG